MSNRKIGNTFEAEFCQMLFDEGFWVHNLKQDSSGQPADIIAVRYGMAHLIDCKVCENDVFPFSRIEPNQKSAMNYWYDCGNGRGWFALQLSDKSVWMFAHTDMEDLSKKGASINKDEIKIYGEPFREWV